MVPARAMFVLAASLMVAGPLAAQPAPRLVTVAGEGTIEAVPDRAFVTAGVTTQAKTAREALAGNARSMAEVLKVLRESGVADPAIRTTSVALHPLTAPAREGDRAPRIVGYAAGNQVTVQTETAKLGELLDRLVAAGANQISNIRFGLSNEAKVQDLARQEAVRDARRKAELFATAGGARLGRMMSLSEIDASPLPRPPLAMRAAPDAVPVPIAPGEQTVRVNVTVSWELDN